MRDKKMDGFNSNEDAPEYNQLSFARGADARRNGKDLSDNPFPNHCWVRYYRKSWDAGWRDQDMDMGCAVEASFLNDVRYIGAPPGTVIKANSEPLNPRLDLANKSPTGFSWGYRGSGPAQLALAILADYLRDENATLAHYQAFKEKVIAALPEQLEWTLSRIDIEHALTAIGGRGAE